MKIGRRLQQDVVINLFFSGLNIIGVLILTRLSTSVLDAVAFGIFMLTRRYSAGLSTFAELGGSLAQFRYMGIYADDKDRSQQVSLIVLLFYSAISALLVTLTWWAEEPLIALFFPDSPHARWLLWITVALAIEQLLHFNVVNNLLQERRMVLYNSYKFLNIAGIFALIFIWVENVSVLVALILYLILSSLLLLGGQLYYSFPALHQLPRIVRKEQWPLIREIFSFSLVRGLVSFLAAALLVVGPWLLRADLQEVGYIAVIYIFFQTINVIVGPVSQLSMVVSSRKLGADDESAIALGVRLVFGLTVILAIICVVIVYPWHTLFLELLVSNPAIIVGASQYRLLFFCLLPLSVFYGLRGVIEMQWKIPYNFFNLLVAHGLGLLCFFVVRPFYGLQGSVIISLSVTFWTLGILTVWTLRHALKGLSRTDGLSLTLMALLFLGVGLIVRDWLVAHDVNFLFQYAFVIASGGAMPLLWWLIWKPAFVQELLQRTGWAEIATRRLRRFFPKPVP